MNTRKNTTHIFISTGEASGDLIAGKLITSLLKKDPQLKITAMGSQHVKNAGAELFLDSNELAVIGFWEILARFQDIRQAMKKIKQFFKTNKPDLLILVDYPGFNLHLARIAKKAGIRVFFYVSPQIWAWRYGRIKKIKRYVDHMAVLFPFEEKIYQKEQVPVTFVGHPLMTKHSFTLSKEEIYQQLQLDANRPIIAVLPGSRSQEIKSLLPVFVEAVALIKQKIPNAQFILPLASNLKIQEVTPYLTKDIQVVENQTHHCLAVCDAAIAASGTVTLEIALAKVPLVIAYKVSWFTAALLFFLLKTKWVGLCNIAAEQEIGKEFLQFEAKAQNIATEIIQLLQNQVYRNQKMQQLQKLQDQITVEDPSDKAALAVFALREAVITNAARNP
jgi:lipid-A-disaccharide synthase